MKPTNQNKLQKAKEKLKLILIILLVVSVGIFAVNQILKFFYYSELLQTPCELCADLNPNQADCIKTCFSVKIESYDYINFQTFNVSLPT